MIPRYNRISLLVGIPGFLTETIGYVLTKNQGTEELGGLVWFTGTVLLIVGLAYYAKAKGRNPAWGLMGFLWLLGLIVLALLKDRSSITSFPKQHTDENASGIPPAFCAQCGAKLNSQAKFCGSCGTAITAAPRIVN